MPATSRPPQLVRGELIRLDAHLQDADPRGDHAGFERWAREVLAHPCAPHTWTVGLIGDMLADALLERDAIDEAATVIDASVAEGSVAEPFATLRVAELAPLGGDRPRASASAVRAARALPIRHAAGSPTPQAALSERPWTRWPPCWQSGVAPCSAAPQRAPGGIIAG